MSEHLSRREFMSSTAGTLGGGWLWLQLPALTAIAGCAVDSSRAGLAFSTLTNDEGRAMRALAARIFPSEPDSPGAEEAGVAWFVDGAVGGPLASSLEPLRAGLADVDDRAFSRWGVRFDELDVEQQDQIMTEIAGEPFFGLAQFLVVTGMFCSPDQGGNRDHAGFRMLGIEHAPSYQPPFGYYDAELMRTASLSADESDGGVA